MSFRIFLAFLTLSGVCTVAPSLAHDTPIDHIERIVQIYIESGKVHVIYRFRCEERQAMLQLHQMDKNGDGNISAEERKAYFDGVAADLSAALHLEVDGKAMSLTCDRAVKLAPDLSQTFILTAAVEKLPVGNHVGKFTDDFSRTHPGPYRWSPRQINKNGIEVDAAKAPSTGGSGGHDSMISIDLKIVVKEAP